MVIYEGGGNRTRTRSLFRLPSLAKLRTQSDRKSSGTDKGIIITGRLTQQELNDLENAVPRSNARRLPPEILLEIIKLSTNTFPDPFSIHRVSPTPTSPFFASAADAALERRLHAESMAIKRRVSLVSREWNAFATEFLFNSVRVVHKSQLPQLWEAFESRQRRLEESGDGPGCAAWSVREFWVDDEVPVFETIAPDLCPKGPSLVELIKRCRRIVVFRGFGVRVHSPLLKTANLLPVFSYIVRSTENRIWSPDPEEFDNTEHERKAIAPPEEVELGFSIANELEMEMFLKPPNTNSLTSLRVLKLYSNQDFGWAVKVRTSLEFPNLVELHVAKLGALQLATHFIMPSLTKLVWDMIPPTRHYGLDTFLDVHGEGLLELSLLGTPLHLDSLERQCPQLQRLDIALEAEGAWMYSSHSSLQVLGVYNLDATFRNGCVREFCSLIYNLPSLRVVQDASWKSSTMRDRCIWHWDASDASTYRRMWQTVIQTLHARGIKLVDWRGRSVVLEKGSRTRMFEDYIIDRFVTEC
ncbi:hypothetical protein FRC04_008956 [Tulasnella sp. 424]|nr:hypothetical protein FRC04_008956 [Tulasnella sp. 424]KAG8973613.1 hypothetical protein FRC05_008549 [Tulasnella sp. 425]